MNSSKALVLVIGGVILLVLIVAMVVLVSKSGKPANPTIKSAPQQLEKTSQPSQATNAASASQSTVETKEVSISSQGFSPRELTVKSKTTVKFTNDNTRLHTVASNPHPVHTDLPDLSSANLAPTESYSFIFDKVGAWGYHDHLNPSLRGTITVTP